MSARTSERASEKVQRKNWNYLKIDVAINLALQVDMDGSTESRNGRGRETMKISRNVKPTNVYFYFRDACMYTNVVEKQNTLAFTGHMWMVPLETTIQLLSFASLQHCMCISVQFLPVSFYLVACCYFFALSRIWAAVCYCLVFPNVRLSELHGHACTFALVFIYNYQ